MAGLQKVIGLMSGTSLDGIDAALVETDGESLVRPGAALTLAYAPPVRAMLRAAIDEARGVAEGAPVPYAIREAERVLTEAHAEAVGTLLEKAGLVPGDVALIGFHGQTILHRPERRWTWQIGDGALLARLSGIDVVNNFRSADVKAGGQGAPLVPLYHAALAKRFSEARRPRARSAGGGGARSSACDAKGRGAPYAIVNIGGVANVTYIKGDTILAFDTGPGNAAIDDWMHRHTGRPVDESGNFARQGRVHEDVLARMLAHPFFARIPPKSLDRMDFDSKDVEGLSPEDGAATLAAFTAAAILRARGHFPEAPATWIVCGGGRHNRFLMDQLRARLDAEILGAEDAGWRGDFIEAEAFAYLALRSVRGLPLSLPTTTGVPQPMTGGKLHRKP